MRRLQTFLFGLAGVLAFSAIALADTPMDGVFGNTVKITTDDQVLLVYFNPDKTFVSRGPAGDEYGIWRIDGEQICTKVKKGDAYDAESCGVMQPGRKVGDTWEHEVDGKKVKVEIIAGR